MSCISPYKITIVYIFSYTKEKEDASGCKINFERNSIAISYKPFRLDFFQDGDLILTMNNRGLMNFEHYRTKK